MNTMTGHLMDDVHRDPRELEREADRAREDLERTLEDLEERVSPNMILDRTLRVVRENGAEFGRNLADQVRSNPVPTILTGIGVAWLLSGRERHSAARPAADRMRDAAAGTMNDAAGTMHDAAPTLRDAVGRAKSSVQHAVHEVASASRGAQEGYRHLSREQPFVLGALAVAAGAALGALLPSTRAEDEWLGPLGGRATDRLREGAQHAWEGAKESVADAAERVVDEMEPAASDAATSTSAPDDEPSASRNGP